MFSIISAIGVPVVTCPLSVSITPDRIFTWSASLPLGREPRLAGAAAIKIQLNLFNRQRNLRRAAVDHAAQRRPMAFAEGRHAKHVAEGVEGHRKLPDGPLGPYSPKLT